MDTAERVENEFENAASPDGADTTRRERSMIEFPYSNLEDAERVAVAIFAAAGMSEVSAEQAGDAISISSASSTFRVLISAAKMFGLVSPDRGVIKLTDLGQQMAHTSTQRAARVAAFLRIPLYKALKDRYDGRALPPPAALEREMGALGVAPKQTSRARQSFDRSARHAGFIKAGSDRFVTPITSKLEAGSELLSAAPMVDGPRQGGSNGGSGHGGEGLDPLIAALIQKLPSAGSQWPTGERVMWLRMAAMAFQMAYDGQADMIEIRVQKSDGEG